MSHKRIEELQKENLCTHFILPLLKMNKFSFAQSNFINSYLTSEKRIVVQVIDKHFVHGKCVIHPEFEGILTDKDYLYYVYRVPSIWWEDLELFKEGKYSEMSELAKDTIRVQSGLPVNQRTAKGQISTDFRLLALDKSSQLKDWWEEILHYRSPQGVVDIPSYMDKGMELLSIPGNTSFIELDLLTQETGEIPDTNMRTRSK